MIGQLDGDEKIPAVNANVAAAAVREFVSRQIDQDTQPAGFRDAEFLFSEAVRLPEIVGGLPSFAPHLVDEGHSGYSEDEIAGMAADQDNGFYWPARNRVIAWLLGRYFPKPRGCSISDVAPVT